MASKNEIVESQKPQGSNKRRTVDAQRGDEFDIIGNRFDIMLDQPLEEFSNDLCKAYMANDRNEEYKSIYALIGINTLPFRDRTTEIMQRGSVPYLMRCHATGAVTLSKTKETQRAFILQRPSGKRLSDVSEHSGPLPESFVIKQVIQPISEMIHELGNQGVNHGCINANTVYFDKEVLVEGCSALPSGYLQIDAYESLERNLALAAGKGSGSTTGDYFSLGILALHLLLGYLPNQEMKKDQLIERIIRDGAYNTYIPELDVSDTMQDFLRGTINENSLERWDGNQIEGWLRGKRYTVLSGSKPKDSIRPFEYRNNKYFTRQHIAYALFKDWKMSKIHLSGYALLRWLESNIKKSDVCTQVDRIIPISNDEQAQRPLKDKELARLLSTLDPQAPIRYRLTSTHIDGMGASLADAFRKNNGGYIQQLIATIESNLPAYVDGLTSKANSISSTILWRLQSMRPILKTKTIGFGFERILYQLSPSLSCQQSLLLSHYTYTLGDVLSILNNLAAKHAKTTSLVDRHIAAFLTNRLEINREIRIVELNKYPDLAEDERLVMLKILTLAQIKLGNPKLPGLTQWAVEMVLPVLDKIHQKSQRKRMRNQILKLADSGVLERITAILFDKQLFNYDRREHSRAVTLYRFHSEMYRFLQDRGRISLKSRVLGHQAAWAIGMFVLAMMVYQSSKGYI